METNKPPVCPNCRQWQYYPTWDGEFYDCCNGCATRGFAPKIMEQGEANTGMGEYEGEGDRLLKEGMEMTCKDCKVKWKIYIELCPLHASAGKLLEQLVLAHRMLLQTHWNECEPQFLDEMQAAINAAKEKPHD